MSYLHCPSAGLDLVTIAPSFLIYAHHYVIFMWSYFGCHGRFRCLARVQRPLSVECASTHFLWVLIEFR